MNAATSEITLLVSDSTSVDYNFKYAQLPEILKEHSYTMVDTSEGSAFINVNHLRPNSQLGTVYISDSTGSRFAISLEDNVRTEDGQCDFERVRGLEGIYIANVYDPEQAALYKEDAVDLQRFKQTRISFDKGSRWQPIAPPRDEWCQDCGLHLHSVSSRLQYGPLYSTENSIGVILSTGNVGKHLSYRADQVNTYLSRDGGLEWHRINEGSHIYEIGDHGGLIVLASDQHATTVLQYSWDEGLTWESFQFSEDPVEVTNILTEPSNTATRFVVYGTTQTKNDNGRIEEQGIVATVDFKNLHQRNCQGVTTPNDKDSDYEEWTPNGKINPECLMGKKVTYVRRKREAQCFNGEEMERQKLIDFCKCTEEDWECDLGFHRGEDGTCQMNPFFEVNYDAPKECNDYYYVTQGYRKVAGN